MNKKYILERMREASTWRGMMMILTAFGVYLSPELKEAIISSGLALSGLIGVICKDSNLQSKDEKAAE